MTGLIQQWRNAKKLETLAIQKRKDIEKQLLDEHEDDIIASLDKDYGTGTATIKNGAGKLVLNFPKRVTWDNDKLGIIWENITEAGDTPLDYMDRKLSVSENKYKNLPSNIQNVFQYAREVKAGNPTFTWKE